LGTLPSVTLFVVGTDGMNILVCLHNSNEMKQILQKWWSYVH